MKKSMYVVNVALKREDGKIEQDTFCKESKPTLELAEEIAKTYSCDVILSCVGFYVPYAEKFQNEYTFVAKAPEKKEEENEV